MDTKADRFTVEEETNEDRPDDLGDPKADVVQASRTDVEDGAVEAPEFWMELKRRLLDQSSASRRDL